MKNKNQLKRMEEMIKNDRFSGKDEFIELLKKDLSHVLKDYFDFKEIPEPILNRVGDKIEVSLSFTAFSIKPFSTLP